MIRTNNTYNTNAKEPVKQLEARLLNENGGVLDTGAGDIISIKLAQAGQFLGVATKKITITAIGDKSALAGQKVKFEIGITNPTTRATDWASQGFFLIENVAVNLEKGTSEITGEDLALVLAKTEYASVEPFTFPTTVQQLAEQIATANGLTLGEFSSLPNAGAQIAEDLYAKIKGFTVKNIIEEIAQATGTTARIQDEALVFHAVTSPSVQTLTASNLKTFKLGEHWGVANALVISRQPQNDDIATMNNQSRNQGRAEIKIINNEILDDNRREMIQPLYNALIAGDSLELDQIEAKTEGHGFYEIGDKITLQAEGKTAVGIISQINITVSGSLTETLICDIPETTKTDYTATGSIRRTIYNTEIKTDKQAQQITAVVSKQETLERETFERYTQLSQNIENFTYQVSKAGGLNFIKNSAFFSEDQQTKKPHFWTIDGAGTITADSSPEAKLSGSISARAVRLRNLKISQEIAVAPNIGQVAEDQKSYYSLSFRLKKSPLGAVAVDIYDGAEKVRNYNSPAGVSTNWDEIKIEGIEPHTNTLRIEITADNGDTAELSDIMLANSKTATNWQLAQGEIANTQVVIDEKGIFVKSSVNQGDYTIISEQEFSGYSRNENGDIERAFTLNKGRTEVKELKADRNVYIAPIKFVPIRTGQVLGVAIVASQETTEN